MPKNPPTLPFYFTSFLVSNKQAAAPIRAINSQKQPNFCPFSHLDEVPAGQAGGEGRVLLLDRLPQRGLRQRLEWIG